MKVLAVSGSRADYGLLSETMRAIAAAPALELRLALTGGHLERRFDETRDAVEADGFRIDAEIPLGSAEDTPLGIAEITGRVLGGMARAFSEIGPDIALMLGDRYEIFAAAGAAAIMNIPVAHMHGGEATTGAVDDALRNAITKISSLHFTAAEDYRRRVIQMGEAPDRVFSVGAPGIELLLKTKRAPVAELWSKVGRTLKKPFVLVTYHPETAGAPNPGRDIGALLSALESSGAKGILFTGVNADARRDEVADAITAFVGARPDRAALVGNLGQRLYWTAMAQCAAVVGNSSSGIIEAPVLKIPTVNVGSRQDGRLRAPSIIDCGPGVKDISAALARAFGRDVPLAGETPYGQGDTSTRIVDVLTRTDVRTLLPKPFYDLPPTERAA